MDKRTIKIIYLVVLTVECYFCYIWLIKPVAPVVLALMKGTYDLEPFTIVSGATSIFRTLIQALTFALLIVGTTKLYKHLYVSLPNDSDSDSDTH